MNVNNILKYIRAVATILPIVTELAEQVNGLIYKSRDNKDGSEKDLERLKEAKAKSLKIKEDLKKATKETQRILKEIEQSLKEIERLKHESDHDFPKRQ